MPPHNSANLVYSFYLSEKFLMAKKEWKEVPESELTEEEVRKWFNRLRELYKEMTHKLHERKIEIKEMNVMIVKLRHEKSILQKENKHLKQITEQRDKKAEKTDKAKVVEESDFKKRFLDSL